MNKLLLGYTINGLVVGTDIGYWYGSDLNGNQPFIIINGNESIPEGYTDISSIKTWHNFGISLVNDYLVCKTEIKKIADKIGFSGCTDEEKILAIKYYSYNTSNPTEVVIYLMSQGYSQNEAEFYLLEQWHIHHGYLINSCKQRWYYVKLVVTGFLAFVDCEDLLNTVEMLVFSYNDIGRMGWNYGDRMDGIMDYIESTGKFTDNGLKEKNYTLRMGDINTFIYAMKNVLINGVYTKYENFKLD